MRGLDAPAFCPLMTPLPLQKRLCMGFYPAVWLTRHQHGWETKNQEETEIESTLTKISQMIFD